MLGGCIPVLFGAEGAVELPFLNTVPHFNNLTVTIAPSELPGLEQALLAIPPDRIVAMRNGLRMVWENFAYASHALLLKEAAVHTRRRSGIESILNELASIKQRRRRSSAS